MSKGRVFLLFKESGMLPMLTWGRSPGLTWARFEDAMLGCGGGSVVLVVRMGKTWELNRKASMGDARRNEEDDLTSGGTSKVFGAARPEILRRGNQCTVRSRGKGMSPQRWGLRHRFRQGDSDTYRGVAASCPLTPPPLPSAG